MTAIRNKFWKQLLPGRTHRLDQKKRKQRISWAKDFSLHTMQAYADSRRTLPNGFYDGMTLRINLQELANHPPEPLEDAEVIGTLLYEKFCPERLLPFLCGEQRDRDHFQFFL